MLNKFRNLMDSMSKKSNMALYIVAALMFIIATIYIVVGIVGLL